MPRDIAEASDQGSSKLGDSGAAAINGTGGSHRQQSVRAVDYRCFAEILPLLPLKCLKFRFVCLHGKCIKNQSC